MLVTGASGFLGSHLSQRLLAAGARVENYGRRGLRRGVTVVHNSVYGNGQGGIKVSAQGLVDAAILNHAAQARAGTPALPRRGRAFD